MNMQHEKIILCELKDHFNAHFYESMSKVYWVDNTMFFHFKAIYSINIETNEKAFLHK